MKEFILIIWLVVIGFTIADLDRKIGVLVIESKQIKEYASQSEFNSRSCTYKKER